MNFVVNCMHFTLKASCYFEDGMRIDIDKIDGDEIYKVILATGADSVTLMGPIAMTEKIAQEIRNHSDIKINILGGTYE